MARLEVSLERLDDSFHFLARNAQGIEVHLDDASSRADGVGLGLSPMQMLLMSLGGCSAIDLASILGKSRKRIDRLAVEVSGDKPDGVAPSLFSTVHVRFIVDGELEASRVQRAVDLSLGKYCSVAKTLEPTATITAEFVLNGVSHAWATS